MSCNFDFTFITHFSFECSIELLMHLTYIFCNLDNASIYWLILGLLNGVELKTNLFLWGLFLDNFLLIPSVLLQVLTYILTLS
jgi:hypothetical protein